MDKINYKIPLVYIAGPYRSESAWGIEQNIQVARRAGAEVACLGAYPVIPHANTSHFEGLLPDHLPDDEFWLKATLALMMKCDAVKTIDGWEKSFGACQECKVAKEMSIPVFHSIVSLQPWINRWIERNGQ